MVWDWIPRGFTVDYSKAAVARLVCRFNRVGFCTPSEKRRKTPNQRDTDNERTGPFLRVTFVLRSCLIAGRSAKTKMKAFATLSGTDSHGERHQEVFQRLFAYARDAGFTPGDVSLPIRSDQTPLYAWRLDYRGPGEEEAIFLLAVTAPKVPSMSPIPIKQTLSCPLFSVVVMPKYFGVWSENRPKDSFTEVASEDEVTAEFRRFLDRLPKEA